MFVFVYLLATTSAIANQGAEPAIQTPPAPVVYKSPLPQAERMALRQQGYAEPLGNPGEWVTTDDYPESALAEERSGTVAFRLQVDAAGRVSTCEIAESSGHGDLDDATCALVSERARFKPALDMRGDETVGTYSNRVKWQIPRSDVPVPTSGSHTLAFTIETDGTISNCKQSGSLLNDLDLCATGPTFVAPVNDSGKAVRKRVVYTSTTEVSDVAKED
jgi:TonB family protein